METKEKVSFIHSITAKIMLMVVVMVALSLMVCISIANVRASATVNNVNENFILSLTESAAKTLDKIPAEVDFPPSVQLSCRICAWRVCRLPMDIL